MVRGLREAKQGAPGYNRSQIFFRRTVVSAPARFEKKKLSMVISDARQRDIAAPWTVLTDAPGLSARCRASLARPSGKTVDSLQEARKP